MVRIVGIGASPDLLEGVQKGIVHGLVVDDARGTAEVVLNALKAGAAGEALEVSDTGRINTPLSTIKTDVNLGPEEMMNALKVQVPWISETAPGKP